MTTEARSASPSQRRAEHVAALRAERASVPTGRRAAEIDEELSEYDESPLVKPASSTRTEE
jgi:hypothetical protein